MIEYTALDEANLEAIVEFTNEGDSRTEGSCNVVAYDASGRVGSGTMGTRGGLRPGQSKSFRGAIRIEDEGAFRVERVEVTDCI